jgi:hypothetical protein
MNCKKGTPQYKTVKNEILTKNSSHLGTKVRRTSIFVDKSTEKNASRCVAPKSICDSVFRCYVPFETSVR